MIGDIPICYKCGLALYPGYTHNHIHENNPLVVYNSPTLFTDGKFISHSGKELDFKIDADALSNESIETLAKIINKKMCFSEVYGIPTGGERLAKALEKYVYSEGGLLIVDDVLTTGSSMEEAKNRFGRLNTQGIVIFARNKCPDWIQPLFMFNSYF